MRMAIGCALRRTLRGKDLPAQIAALLALVREPQAALAALRRRFTRGLRRRPKFAAPVAGRRAAPALPAPECAFANTS
jgi:hypothetical protein